MATFSIILDSQAIADLHDVRAYDRRAILDTMSRILSSTPTRVGKSRIKRLRRVDSPQFRLRVGEFRVFYNVIETKVYVLRVLNKTAVDEYLKELGYGPENGQR